MATYKEKDGSKSFRMNPQQGRALRGGGDKAAPKPGGGGKDKGINLASLTPGLHQKAEMGQEGKGAGEHLHMGHPLAHHVEIHHGGHTEGSPAMHEGHTHHTITHHQGHGGGGMGGGSDKGDQFTAEGGLTAPTITNHESSGDAIASAGADMHDGCPECMAGSGGGPTEEEADYQTPSDEGIPV